jgi:hypothetical protein
LEGGEEEDIPVCAWTEMLYEIGIGYCEKCE